MLKGTKIKSATLPDSAKRLFSDILSEFSDHPIQLGRF